MAVTDDTSGLSPRTSVCGRDDPVVDPLVGATPWLDAQAETHATGRRQMARGVLSHAFATAPERIVDAPDGLVER